MTRLACLAVLLTGCIETVEDDQAPPNVRPPSPVTAECDQDVDCGDLVCARTHECVAQSDLREVHVNWTAGGFATTDPKAADFCYWTPTVRIEVMTNIDVFTRQYFIDEPIPGEFYSFDRVDCLLGRFTIDKLPSWYSIGAAAGRSGAFAAPFDATGTVTADVY